MADKPVVPDVGAASQYAAAVLNNNFSIVEEAIEGCLGRGGTGESPNSMTGDLDMDLHDILNIGDVAANTLTLDGDLVVPNDLAVTTLPSQTLNADKLLSTGGSSAKWVDGIISLYTVALMKAASIQEGTSVETKGYYTKGDGGQARYLIKTAVDYVDTPDEYGDHTLANGNVAVLQYEGAVNVKWFGTIGDGVADDTVAIQAAIDASSGGTLVGKSGEVYSCVGLVSVTSAITIRHASFVFWTDAIDQGFFVNASNVKFKAVVITGPQSTVDTGSQRGIYALGADSSNYLTGLEVSGCTIANFGGDGVRLGYAEDFNIFGNSITSVVEHGILVTSALGGSIYDNDISGVGLIGLSSYGIQATRSDGTLVDRPRSKNVRIFSNTIQRVKYWEGIDTHGGENIHIYDNDIIDCMIGIAMTRVTGVVDLGCINCTAHNNRIINETLPVASVRAGIQCVGDLTEYSTGCHITDNTIARYGDNTAFGTDTSTAIYCYANENLLISGNIVKDSGSSAIGIIYMGENIVVDNNLIDDLNPTTNGAGIWFDARGGVATGQARNNLINVPTYSGIYVFESMIGFDMGVNQITATNNYDQDGGIEACQYIGEIEKVISGVEVWDPASIAAGSSETHIATNIQGMSPNCMVDVTVNRDLQGLTLQTIAGGTDIHVGQISFILTNATAGAINIGSLNMRYRADLVR